MLITKLRIDGQMFYLTDGQDVPALKEQIVTAVNEGSRFVDFTAVGHGLVSVLMTPRLTARLEILERTEEQVAEWEQTPPHIDVDFDFLEYH